MAFWGLTPRPASAEAAQEMRRTGLLSHLKEVQLGVWAKGFSEGLVVGKAQSLTVSGQLPGTAALPC